MGTSMYVGEHHFPHGYSGVAHRSSSRKTKNSRRKNLFPVALALLVAGIVVSSRR